MKTKRPPVPILILLVLALLTGAYFGIKALTAEKNNGLSASGTIEADRIAIAPEIGGKVAEVYVNEGDTVQAGDPLFRLDDTLLQAQRAVAAANLDLARAALDTAQAQYELTVTSAWAESAASRTQEWRASNPADYTLPSWYFSRDEQIAAGEAEWEAAKRAHVMAWETLDHLLARPELAEFQMAEARLLGARAAFLTAQEALSRAGLASDSVDIKAIAQAAYDAAQTELQQAQSAYDDLADDEAAQNALAARTDLAVAQVRLDSARDRLLVLRTGIDSPRVAVAWATIEQASEAASQAEAALALLDVQLGKLSVSAPADGVVLTRAVEPGEVVMPGARLLTLGRLDSLTITVYVPEDRYGELSLGQAATVTVDSFPGQTFIASVVQIAGQAEFTPRNVQTVEGRSGTVYAVRLQVEDPDGKLKPGMPADVVFAE